MHRAEAHFEQGGRLPAGAPFQHSLGPVSLLQTALAGGHAALLALAEAALQAEGWAAAASGAGRTRAAHTPPQASVHAAVSSGRGSRQEGGKRQARRGKSAISLPGLSSGPASGVHHCPGCPWWLRCGTKADGTLGAVRRSAPQWLRSAGRPAAPSDNALLPWLRCKCRSAQRRHLWMLPARHASGDACGVSDGCSCNCSALNEL